MAQSGETAPGFRVVAQMQTQDLAAAAWQLTDRFGFKAERGYLDVRAIGAETGVLRMRRLDQVIELVRCAPGVVPGHGAFDHLAIRANNVDAAVMALRAKGARLDPDVTPDGPIDLPMFWAAGVRIAFALGPQEARIELCQNLATTPDAAAAQFVNVGGHDHYGVRCRDVDEATAFYGAYGFAPCSELEIPTPDGPIHVRFVARGGYLLEIASTPKTRSADPGFAPQGLWSRLIIETDAPDDIAASGTGPNGEMVEIRTDVPAAAFTFDAGDLP